MGRRLDAFVDAMLDDAIRRREQERDFDPAWWRNECPPGNAAVNLSACNRLATAQGLPQVTLNQLRGRCAEQRLVARLCSRRYDVRNQVRVGPRRGGSVLDVSPFPHARRSLPQGLENKYVHVPDYRGCVGGPCPGLCVAAMLQRVPTDVAQVRRHMAQSAPGTYAARLIALPRRIRLFYQLGGGISPAEYRCIAPQFYAAVRAANAATPGPNVQATVVRAM
jgi:hypothetical protein